MRFLEVSLLLDSNIGLPSPSLHTFDSFFTVDESIETYFPTQTLSKSLMPLVCKAFKTDFWEGLA